MGCVGGWVQARGGHYRILSTSQCVRFTIIQKGGRGHEVKKHCCTALPGFQVTVFSKNIPVFPFTGSSGTIVKAML